MSEEEEEEGGGAAPSLLRGGGDCDEAACLPCCGWGGGGGGLGGCSGPRRASALAARCHRVKQSRLAARLRLHCLPKANSREVRVRARGRARARTRAHTPVVGQAVVLVEQQRVGRTARRVHAPAARRPGVARATALPGRSGLLRGVRLLLQQRQRRGVDAAVDQALPSMLRPAQLRAHGHAVGA